MKELGCGWAVVTSGTLESPESVQLHRHQLFKCILCLPKPSKPHLKRQQLSIQSFLVGIDNKWAAFWVLKYWLLWYWSVLHKGSLTRPLCNTVEVFKKLRVCDTLSLFPVSAVLDLFIGGQRALATTILKEKWVYFRLPKWYHISDTQDYY